MALNVYEQVELLNRLEGELEVKFEPLRDDNKNTVSATIVVTFPLVTLKYSVTAKTEAELLSDFAKLFQPTLELLLRHKEDHDKIMSLKNIQ